MKNIVIVASLMLPLRRDILSPIIVVHRPIAVDDVSSRCQYPLLSVTIVRLLGRTIVRLCNYMRDDDEPGKLLHSR